MNRVVIKRDGRRENFDVYKIFNAVCKAYHSCHKTIDVRHLEDWLYEYLNHYIGNLEEVHVETIQDVVEKMLMWYDPEVAKPYILYRENHKDLRYIKERIEYMDSYAESKENAATTSETDANANVQKKNVANLDGEVYKTLNRQIQRYRMKKKLQQMYPGYADNYLQDLDNHIIYAHDEASSPAVKNYTYSPDEVVNFKYNDVECLGSLRTLYDLAVETEVQQEGDGVWCKFPQSLYVKDKDEKYTKVTRLTRKTRYNDMVRVKTAFGEDLVVTANHPLIVSSNKEDRVNAIDSSGLLQLRLPCTLKFKGNKIIDLASCVDYDEVHKSYILTHETQAPYYFTKRYIELNRKLGYVIGFFIGDGNYDNTFNSLMFSQKDKKVLEYLADALFESFGAVSYIHQNNNGIYVLRLCSNIVYDLFRNYFKIKDKAYNKCIPYNVLEFNEDFAKGIIEGIIDSDGTVKNADSAISIRLSSRECIMQLAMLLRYFGYGVSCTHQATPFGNNKTIKTNYDIWGINFTNIKNSVKFDGAIKWGGIVKEIQKSIKYTTGWTSITSVEKLSSSAFLDEKCKFIYDITTESNTFECNNLWVHNCEAVSLYPLLVEGTKGMDGLGTTPPKNLNSFCGQLVNLLFLLSSQCKGAVAFGEFFNFLDYFCVKDFGENYDFEADTVASVKPKRTVRDTIHQAYQQIVYGWNQPAGNRSYQSPFSNISYYDSNYWHALFDEFQFPDGTKPLWRRVDWLQRDFMQWFNKERTKTLLTFPVETMALLSDGYDILDQDYKMLTARMYAEGHSFFTYISDNPNALASCCRLSNKILENVFSFTNGLTGVQTGSANVITLNLNRIVQDYMKREFPEWKPCDKTDDYTQIYEGFRKYLENILDRVYKYHKAYKTLLYETEEKGMLDASTAGYIKMSKLYSTIGINGLNEAAEFLGHKCSYNEGYKEFCNLVTTTISECNKKNSTKEFMFNTELVPAEGLSSKNYRWDKLDGYWVPSDRNLYNSYFYLASDPETSVLDRFRLHGAEFTRNLDGGVGLHCNLEEHLSYKQYMDLITFAVKQGTSYFTFNIPNSECTNKDCGFIVKVPLNKCPKCGSRMRQWTRVIGFLRPVEGFDKERYKEALTRVYSKKDEV